MKAYSLQKRFAVFVTTHSRRGP